MSGLYGGRFDNPQEGNGENASQWGVWDSVLGVLRAAVYISIILDWHAIRRPSSYKRMLEGLDRWSDNFRWQSELKGPRKGVCMRAIMCLFSLLHLGKETHTSALPSFSLRGLRCTISSFPSSGGISTSHPPLHLSFTTASPQPRRDTIKATFLSIFPPPNIK